MSGIRRVGLPLLGLPVVGLVATVLVPRLLVFPVLNFGQDEIAYALIGRELWHGHWPYTTAFDHKPVGLYLPYALATGTVGDTTTALRLLSLVIAALGYLLTYVVARRMRVSVPLAAGVASLYSVMTLGNQGLGALSENLLSVYILGMVLMLLLRPGVLTGAAFGALMGLAVHTNYLCGPILAALGLYYLWRERRHLWRWVGAAVGLGAATVALLLPIHLWGSLHDYFSMQSYFLSSYEMPPEVPGAQVQRFQRFLDPLLPVATVCAVLAVVDPATRTRSALRWVGLLAVGVVGISWNGYYWPHYAILLAMPLALLLATQLRTTSLGTLGTASGARAGWVMAVTLAVAVWSLGLPLSKPLADGARSIGRQGNLRPDQSAPQSVVAAAVRDLTDPGDVIYTRNLHYYFLTGTTMPTRFFFANHHLSEEFTRARGSSPERDMRRILAKRPRVVVMDRVGRIPLAQDRVLYDFLEDRCTLDRTIDQAKIYVCR